jgi:protein SCO1
VPIGKNRITLTIISLLCIIALMLGLFIQQYSSKKKSVDLSRFHGTLFQTPREIHSFSLNGMDNMIFDNQRLNGRWTMVFFGFTRCSQLCPTTLAALAGMLRTLEQQKVSPLPEVVFISIDPERDTLDYLKQYVTGFHPRFYAARGEDQTIQAMARELGIAIERVNYSSSETSEGYDIQHSGAVMLFNPEGHLNAFFTTPHQPKLLAEDYQLLLQAGRKD